MPHPPIDNYTNDITGYETQVWDVVQDKRGMIYVAHNYGIFEYDGSSWRNIPINKNYFVLSLDIDKNDRIYAGGIDEFGYLEPDKKGSLQYKSLSDSLPEDIQGFGDVRNIFVLENGIVFKCIDKVFYWHKDTLSVLPAKGVLTRIGLISDTLYIVDKASGLVQVRTDTLIPVKNSEKFATILMISMLPYKKDTFLIPTYKYGLYLYDRKKLFQPDHPLNDYFKKTKLIDAGKGDNYLFSSPFSGIHVLDSLLNLYAVYNISNGLANNKANLCMEDREGNIWVPHNNGISKIEHSSPFSFYGDSYNAPQDCYFIGLSEKVYFASKSGIYYLKRNAPPEHSLFEKMNDLDISAGAFQSHQYGENIYLYESNGNNIFEINKEKVTLIGKEPLLKPLFMHPLSDNLLIGGGKKSKIVIYKKNNTSWKKLKEEYLDETKTILKIAAVTSNAEKKNPGFWLGLRQHGLYKYYPDLTGNDDSTVFYDTTKGLPAHGQLLPYNITGGSLFATPDGIYSYQPETDSFIKDKRFKGLNKEVTLIHEEKPGKIWIAYSASGSTSGIALCRETRDGMFHCDTTTFLPVKPGVIYAIYPEDDRYCWFGGTKGIIRFDAHKQYITPDDFSALIRRVDVKDSILFNGAFYDQKGYVIKNQPDHLKQNISYDNNSFTFHFAANSFVREKEMEFSHWLEGYDEEWSDWTGERKAIYTNLPEGKYHFRVKAKNIYDHISKEAVYEMKILPPWYRTNMAYAGYGLLFISLVYGAVWLNGRRLRAENIKLEHIVEERTKEVVAQRDIIARKNKDITDSITYAQRIQEAILVSQKDLKDLFRDCFVLNLPRDIISGDFYWVHETDSKVIWAVADCTGHGVPGALMSMIGNALLNEAIIQHHIEEPDRVLNYVREGVISSLLKKGYKDEINIRQSSDATVKDGMDMGICVWKKDKGQVLYAGAMNPLYLIREGELIEYKADRQPVGYYTGDRTPFTKKIISTKPDDRFYLFSDGFADQFGGIKGKKFSYRRFKELLLNNHTLSMDEQRDILFKSFNKWKMNEEQIDDVLVMGVVI